jgi:carboxyl-terminal processing protease
MNSSRRLVRALLLGVLLFAGGWRPAAAQTNDTVPLAKRQRITAELDRGIRRYFAHLAGAPDLTDYPAVDAAYREKALATPSRRDFDLATLEFMARLHNGHTDFNDRWLWDRFGAPLGFVVRWMAGRWTIIYSERPGLKVGDVVGAVDGEPMEAFYQRQKRFIPASSDRMARHLFRNRSYLFPQRFTLTLADGRQVEVTRGEPSASAVPPVATATPAAPEAVPHRWLVPDSVAYMQIPSFGEDKYQKRALEVLHGYHGAPALVIDVRGNGGGSTPETLMRQLADRPLPWWWEYSALGSGPMRHLPKTDEIGPNGERKPQPYRPGGTLSPRQVYRGRLVILANIGCGSACEDFVMPLQQTGRATVVGDTTFGSTGQPFIMDFGDGMTARVSGRRAYFPGGKPFEGVGIAPDVYVAPTIAAYQGGADPTLDRALQVVRAPAPPRPSP